MDIISPFARALSQPWTLEPKVAGLAAVGRGGVMCANQVTLRAAKSIYMGRLPVERLGEDSSIWIQGLPGLPRAARAPSPAPLMYCV